MSAKATTEIPEREASPDQAALIELLPVLVQTCRDYGGKLKVKRGDTGVKVNADKIQLLHDGQWVELVFDEEAPEVPA